MSRHIYPKAIYALTEDAISGAYRNTDFPKDTIICEDKDGEWYVYSPPFDPALSSKHSWPNVLFRDYWRILPSEMMKDDFDKMSLYCRSIKLAAKRKCKMVNARR